MAIHPSFPTSPYEILNPDYRWFPADETLRETSYEKLLPPLVSKIRKEVKAWRDNHYEGASETSKALLAWWFHTEHILPKSDGNMFEFRYYFAQREAIKTVIYLYEADSKLSTNFLVIAPNIIVLDRLRTDFDGLKIFWNDPLLPGNGYEGQNWQDDFQMTLHIQDDVSIVRKSGNLFLTNIHRVYAGNDIEPSFDDENLEDYFLGKRPECTDVISYTKNYLAVHFTSDYVNADGNISHYYPDFIVNTSDKDLFIVETKGLEYPDAPLKMARLKKWCEDINASQKKLYFDFVFVDEEYFNKYKPDSISSLINNFRKYKDDKTG